MARRPIPEQPQSANLTPEQMKRAIPILKRRIAELEDIDVNTIQERGEPRFEALVHKIDYTLAEIFGSNTIEYHGFTIYSLDTTGHMYCMRHPCIQ